MATLTTQITILMFLLLSSITINISLSNNHNLPRCHEKDRETLLTFKKGVIDRYDNLSTWTTEEDCRAWKGVNCNNIGRVTMIDLNSQSLEGEINFAFLELEFLNYLDLSYNSFDVITSPPIPHNITHASYLNHLDLSNSNLNMDDFHWLSQFSSLKYLDLSWSNIHGEIPSSLLNLRNLNYLDLSYNMFSGSIPSSLGNLSSLVSLFIGSNYFSGEISEATFSNLSHLDYLDMSNSTMAFRFDPQWVPPFQLTDLYLANTNQGPSFPLWIYTQKSLQALDLSNTGISFDDLSKVMSFVEGVSYLLDLSKNSIRGDISNVMLKASVIKLGHNNFTRRLPHISPMANVVDFSYNSFSGSIPYSWRNLKDLWFINMWNNRLSGNVFGHFSDMKSLEFMNLGKNEFSGTIPINIPQNLEVIILRANQFEGNIPSQLFNLPYLFHLDLAHNKFHGSMPRCLYNMTEMIISEIHKYPGGTIDLFTKGQDYLYKVDPQRRTIDLSANSLSGEVPLKLFQLIQVQTLNLSHNNFSGSIPNMIGGMINMESLDLSNNKFSGKIPQNLTLLHFLGYLNLSYNNLNGQIPIGTQLQSFNASSYIGNPGLCGDPLKKCFIEEVENPRNGKSSSRNQDSSDPFRESLYEGMGVGFAAGFWGICGSLFLIRKWRHAFFRFFDQVTDKLYVAFLVKLNKFRKTRPPSS